MNQAPSILHVTKAREHLWQLLGKDHTHTHFVACAELGRQLESGATNINLMFTTNNGNTVPATFLAPTHATSPTPAILYCHAHGARYDIGRKELINGRKALISSYDRSLIELGYSVLCLEMPCFGERQHLAESATAKTCQWQGHTLFGWMLGELIAGISFLVSNKNIDSGRIATLGISMGGTHAWWLAALDDRVRTAVSLCCFADLGDLIRTGQHDGHGHYMTVPGLLRSYSTAQVASLTAPRAQFIGVGLQDWSTPERSFNRARDELENCYEKKHSGKSVEFYVEPDTGHVETEGMRMAALNFLQHHL